MPLSLWRMKMRTIIIIIWGKVDDDDEEEEDNNNNMGGPVVGRTWSICFMFPIGSGSRPW